MIDEENLGDKEEVFAFRSMDAMIDLRGNPLGAGSRSRASLGSSGGRKNSKRWREK